MFEGKIITSKDSYYVENARHYFPNQSHVDKGFHSIIYNEKHVDDPFNHLRKGHAPGCGITEEVSEWMERIQNAADSDIEPSHENGYKAFQFPIPFSKLNSSTSSSKNSNKSKDSNISKKHPNSLNFQFPYEKYTKEANYRTENDGSEWHHNSHERVRRAASRQKDDNRNTCSLYIQTDPLIWRHIREGVADVSNDNFFEGYNVLN